jgi:hypothetical protein
LSIFKIPLNPPLQKGDVKSRVPADYVGGIVCLTLRTLLHSFYHGASHLVNQDVFIILRRCAPRIPRISSISSACGGIIQLTNITALRL